MIKLLIDNKEIEAPEGSNLLQTCLDNEIYIPNLCYLKAMKNPPASCRMCFVEIMGEERPVASCTVQVTDGMVVSTDTPAVRQLQRAALQLLLSVHHVNCARCPANKKCELQHIAKFLKLGLKPKGLEPRLKEIEINRDHPCLEYYPNRCVLCGRCVFVCQRRHGRSFLAFAKRGLDTVISFYGEKGSPNLPCGECIDCVEVCPVGAITLKNSDLETASN